jgi:hypothetical protein
VVGPRASGSRSTKGSPVDRPLYPLWPLCSSRPLSLSAYVSSWRCRICIHFSQSERGSKCMWFERICNERDQRAKERARKRRRAASCKLRIDLLSSRARAEPPKRTRLLRNVEVALVPPHLLNGMARTQLIYHPPKRPQHCGAGVCAWVAPLDCCPDRRL